MRFREHRGGLAEAMETLIEIPDRAALVAHCRKLLMPFSFAPADLTVLRAYFRRPDTRIGWPRTYIVCIKGYGIVGFTDAPCSEAQAYQQQAEEI